MFLSTSNKKLRNIESLGLFLPLLLSRLLTIVIFYFSRFFLLIIIDTFMKIVVVSYSKKRNLPIYHKKLINLRNLGLLLLLV